MGAHSTSILMNSERLRVGVFRGCEEGCGLAVDERPGKEMTDNCRQMQAVGVGAVLAGKGAG